MIKRTTVTQDDIVKLKTPEAQADVIRQLRKPLLEAFDKYKTNISYGVITETEAQHEVVVDWYRRLLDRDPEAIRSVPEIVHPYM